MTNLDLLRKEHDLVRNEVAFYDFTLETIEVSGEDATKLVDYIFVNDIASLPAGKSIYSSMLGEDGYIIDDNIMFKRQENPDLWWITTANGQRLYDWFEKNKADHTVTIKDISSELGIYAVQGPKSKDVINKIVEDDIGGLDTFEFLNTTTNNGVELMVARNGFTGELGYELHLHPDSMEKVATLLKEAGVEEISAEEVTVGSLPVEKGFLQEHDFAGTSPLEIGLAWTVNYDKDFIGKDKTVQFKEEGAPRKLYGFALTEDAEAEENDKVYHNGEEVGKVTKYTYGFSVDKYIGYALVDSKLSKGDEITIKTAKGEFPSKIENKIFYK